MSDCKYTIPRLDSKICLFNSNLRIDIDIDNGFAEIDALSGSPLCLQVDNLSINEQTSLDGRYRFQCTVEFSVYGYYGLDLIGDYRYIMVRTMEGRSILLNADFPSEPSYEFTLDKETYSTRYRFEILSNFPSLSCDYDFPTPYNDCMYKVGGIRDIELDFFRSARLDRDSEEVIYADIPFWNADFIDASLSETYTEGYVSASLNYTVAVNSDNYAYLMQEFPDNIYVARVTPYANDSYLFLGFDLGLRVAYSTSISSDSDGYVTVTLSTIGNDSIVALGEYTDVADGDRSYIPSDMYWHCSSDGVAYHTLKYEIDSLENPTGNYICYSGMTSYFEGLGYTIVGEFDEQDEFPCKACIEQKCSIDTSIPQTIVFNGIQNKVYSIISTCDWRIGTLPNGISCVPMSGEAGVTYSLTVGNTSITRRNGTFPLYFGDRSMLVMYEVRGAGTLWPEEFHIDADKQQLKVQSTEGYNFTATASASTSSSTPYIVSQNGQSLTLEVGENPSTEPRSFTLNCILSDGRTQSIPIEQSGRYEEWRARVGQYICASGTSRQLETLWTGSTLTNMKETMITRLGADMGTSTECSETATRWIDRGNLQCIDGNTYQVLEEDVWEDGYWMATGRVKLGDFVESGATICETAIEEWRRSNDWVCLPD